MTCLHRPPRQQEPMGLRAGGIGPGYPLVWVSHGALLWLPARVREGIASVWNRTNCFMFGHWHVLRNEPEDYDADGRYACPNCCKRFDPKVTGRSA